MSNVNVIQGLFILAARGDGGTGSNKPTETSKVMNLTIIQAHLSTASTQCFSVYGQLQQISLLFSAICFIFFLSLSLTEREQNY